MSDIAVNCRLKYTLYLTRRERRSCSHFVPRARSLRLGHQAALSFMRLILIALVAALTGCGRSGNPTNPAIKVSDQIRQWVTNGNSLTSAQHIMEQHGFKCS